LQVRLLQGLAKIHASLGDPSLVSRAGLVPVMTLAQRAGLGRWPVSACGSPAGVG